MDKYELKLRWRIAQYDKMIGLFGHMFPYWVKSRHRTCLQLLEYQLAHFKRG
jgi:hypothetical protein